MPKRISSASFFGVRNWRRSRKPTARDITRRKNLRTRVFALECLQSDLQDLLATLKPNQRLVLMLQFGLSGEDKLTAKQVAQKLNLSHSKVRSAHGQGIKALRREQDRIKNYLVS